MKNTLLENYLASQFKFGFELEAFKTDGWINYQSARSWEDDQMPEYDDGNEDEESHWDDDQPIEDDDYSDGSYRTYELEEARKEVEKDIKKAFGFDVSIKSDSSLEPDSDDDFAFEWATPVMDFNPKTIKKCIDGLDYLMRNDYYTNNSCGFHVHLSFPNISDSDCVWIISKLALDEDMLWTLSDGVAGCDFYNEDYADMEFLRDLADCLRDGQYEGLSEVFTTEKYRMLHIHPQGTIEWRGPRDFMDQYINNKPIYEFFKLLHKFVRWISKTLASNKILGMSKDNYFKIIFDEDYKDGDLIHGFKYKEKQKAAARKLTRLLKNDDSSSVIDIIKRWSQTYDFRLRKSISIIYDILNDSVSKGDMKYTKFVKDLLLKTIGLKDDKIRSHAIQFLDTNRSILSEGFRFLTKEEMTYYFMLALSADTYAPAITIPVISNQENNDVIEAFNIGLRNCTSQELNKYGLRTIFSYFPMVAKSGKYIKSPEVIDEEALHTEIFKAINNGKLSYDEPLAKGSHTIKSSIFQKNKDFNTVIQICLDAHENEVLASVVNQVLNKIYTYWSSPQPYINTMKEEIICKYLQNIILTGNTDYEFNV